MSSILFKNIGQLCQIRSSDERKISGSKMRDVPTLPNAFLHCVDGLITEFGTMRECAIDHCDEVIDADGGTIIPTWCDSHTHLVYADNRIGEFVDRINGLSYQEIAARGGGILNSAKNLQSTSEEDLYLQSAQRLAELVQLGTGSIEIKSGYGLAVEAELKMLRVIKRLQRNFPVPIKSTLLAAHALPAKYNPNRQDFLDLVLLELIPRVAEAGLADYIDVFCEHGYFSAREMDDVLTAGGQYGLVPKVHVNQFSSIGGIEVALEHNALSVDHLEVLTGDEIKLLSAGNTMPVALPGCSFFLGIPYCPVRKLMNANVPVALASDFNPGSAPSGNMNFILSTACIKMKMTPKEAINAATINGAYAMGLADEVGSITKGKRANLILTKPIPHLAALPYHFGSNLIEAVYINGQKWPTKNLMGG